MNITLDKIASVTKNIPLTLDVTLTDNIVCEEGAVIAVKVLEDKKIYNQLELPSGRLSTLKKGDLVAVALGNRRALKGFVGEVPKSLKVGDTLNVLNLGGVSGLCTSENLKEVGAALKAEVLGAVATSATDSTPLNIKDYTLFSKQTTLTSKVPLIVVSGTCMNVGKTSVACEIIKQAHGKKFKIFGAKMAGVAALKDTENMKDYGAQQAVSFIDAGCPSTVNNGNTPVDVTKGALNHLAQGNPDFIVVEFGDGVYGEYGVMKILKDPEIQATIKAHIGCAHDPMGAAKLAEVCAEIGAPLNMISGPVTDNSVGVQFINEHLKLPAFNALYHGEELFHHLLSTCLKK